MMQQPRRRKCFHSSGDAERQESLIRSVLTQLQTRDLGDPKDDFYVRIRYIWVRTTDLITTDLEKLMSITRLQHVELVKAFQGDMDVYNDRLTNVKPYDYQRLFDKAQISLLPTEATTLSWNQHVFFLDHSGQKQFEAATLTDILEVVTWVEEQSPFSLAETDMLNVIITDLGTERSKDLLGVALNPYTPNLPAFLKPNFCICQWFTIGSSQGALATGPFSAGKTVIHELGHVLGTLHTFDREYQNMLGSITQDTPNYWLQKTQGNEIQGNVTELALDLYRLENGQSTVYDWNNTDLKASIADNIGVTVQSLRASDIQRDVQALYEEYLSASNTYTGMTFSEGFNYMDYSADEFLLYFNALQVGIMRAVMSDDDTLGLYTQRLNPNLAHEIYPTNTDTKEDNASSTTNTTNTLWSWYVILLTALVGVMILLFLLWWFWWRKRVQKVGQKLPSHK